MEALKDLAVKHDLYIFADEVYREFCYDGHEHFSVMQLEGLEQNAILLDSVSKRYSACGFRIGAFITRNQAVLDTALKFGQARLSPPSFGQFASEAALETPPEYFKEVFEYTMTIINNIFRKQILSISLATIIFLIIQLKMYSQNEDINYFYDNSNKLFRNSWLQRRE